MKDQIREIKGIKKKQTNAERIRNMTDEELARALACWECGCSDDCSNKEIKGFCENNYEVNLKWLQEEAKE